MIAVEIFSRSAADRIVGIESSNPASSAGHCPRKSVSQMATIFYFSPCSRSTAGVELERPVFNYGNMIAGDHTSPAEQDPRESLLEMSK